MFITIVGVGSAGTFYFITGIEAKRTQEALVTLVNNVREWPDRPSPSLRTDITDPLKTAGLLPAQLQNAQVKLLAGKTEMIEVVLGGLSPSQCYETADYVGRRSSVRDLYSIWLGGAGKLIMEFPPKDVKEGCLGKRIEIRLQYRLKKARF